jgi:hypothetical protein
VPGESYRFPLFPYHYHLRERTTLTDNPRNGEVQIGHAISTLPVPTATRVSTMATQVFLNPTHKIVLKYLIRAPPIQIITMEASSATRYLPERLNDQNKK